MEKHRITPSIKVELYEYEINKITGQLIRKKKIEVPNIKEDK